MYFANGGSGYLHRQLDMKVVTLIAVNPRFFVCMSSWVYPRICLSLSYLLTLVDGKPSVLPALQPLSAGLLCVTRWDGCPTHTVRVTVGTSVGGLYRWML